MNYDERSETLRLPKSKKSLPNINMDTDSIRSTFSNVSSDIIIKSNIHYGSCLSVFKGTWLDYSRNANIHGLRYIFRIHSSIYEKLIFVLVWLVSLYFAVSYIVGTVKKWQDSPVILGFDETLVPVHKIPFPTITICPEIKSDKNLFNFGNISNNFEYGTDYFDASELHKLIAYLQLCKSSIIKEFAPIFPKSLSLNIAEVLVSLTIPKNETAPFCEWNGRSYFCDKIMHFVATDEGICYQFNGMQTKDIYRDPKYVSYSDTDIMDFNNDDDSLLQLNNDDDSLLQLNNITGNWSLDDGYLNQGYNSYPQRTVFASSNNAFIVLLSGLKSNIDLSNTCRKYKTQGYKVFLNSPESVPSTTSNYILVAHDSNVMVSIVPHYIMSDSNLHDFSPAKRQCYFSNERYLRFFRFYSESNCQTECLVNYTIAKCGCAKFWMPKPLDVPTCSIYDVDCYSTAEKTFNSYMEVNSLNIHTDCDCMSSCTSLDYNFEISRAAFDLKKTIQSHGGKLEEGFIGSQLWVYFKKHQFMAIKRTIFFKTLLANCGSIFGLFMGMSGLSLIELVYFFSVRLTANLRKRRQTKMKLHKFQEDHQE